MIGHGLGAAGALEAIATIKAIETGWLHPTINQFVRPFIIIIVIIIIISKSIIVLLL
jgi:3-oxoacyl-[acyl-carrier-protein] synthase II